MPALDLIRPSVTAMRVIASVNDGFARELKLPPHIRSRCGQNRGAVGRHRGRAGQPGRAVRPEGTVHPHGESADRKPALGHLTQFKNSPAAQQKRTSIQKNRCPF